MPLDLENKIEFEVIKQLTLQNWKQWHPKGFAPLDKDVNNEESLFEHFIECLEKNNNCKFNNIQKHRLKDMIEAIRDDGRKTNCERVYDFLYTQQNIKDENDNDCWVTIIDWKNLRNNIYEISDQLWFNKSLFDNEYRSRKDLFLLINGIPIISIELKKHNEPLKKAFGQSIKYRESWTNQHTLLNLCQLFIISNEVNTLMFGNNDNLSYSTWRENDDSQKNSKAIFYWLDSSNNRINNIFDFIKEFLQPSHVLKYLSQYVKYKSNMFMYAKPHQYHANEIILEHYQNNWSTPAYVWHATASGKTFTMYLAWNNFIEKLNADYCIVVVDRLDLDTQTCRNFKEWEKGITDRGREIIIRSSNKLIKAIKDGEQKIVVTIDKLNNLLSPKKKYDQVNEKIPFFKTAKVAIIFDECHRSLFGEQFKNIKNYFTNAAFLGFTGTPIFKTNNKDFRNITPELFPASLHKYGLSQALADGVILPVDYEVVDIRGENDKEKSIILTNKQEIAIRRTTKYYEKLVEDVMNKLSDKTMDYFYAMLAVSSIDAANLVYELIKGKQDPLTNKIIKTKYSDEIYISADFSVEENYFLDEEQTNDVFLKKCDKHKFKKRVISDYRNMFGEQINDNDDSLFSRSLITRLQQDPRNDQKPLRLVIVVDKLLTGFDSEYVNTLFLDKSLTSYSLIQATSRTTRVSSEEKKVSGLLIAYRTSKEDIERAFSEYSGDKKNEISYIVSNYENRVKQIIELVSNLKKVVPSTSYIDTPQFYENIDKVMEFCKIMRNLSYLITIFEKYNQHKWEDINFTYKDYAEYLSKYEEFKNKLSKTKYNETDVLEDFHYEIINNGFIDSEKIWKLIQKVKTKSDWENITKPNIIQIISTTILSHFEKELLTYLDDAMFKNSYNISDIREFKISFKNFLETLSDNFNDLANDIKEKFKITIQSDLIKEIFNLYKYKPKDSQWIEKLINEIHLENANKIYDFFFESFKTFLDNSKEIKKIVDQVATEI